jgi:outer membrane protein OmpA-like peptidoglycan-associated protein/tetratricopeptide (TPR) repeat protein
MGKMRIVPLFFFLFTLASAVTQAQEEDKGCGTCSDKKVNSYLEKVRDKKKYEFKERMEYARKALEEEPECAAAQLEMAQLQITLAKGNGTSFKPAEKYLKGVVQQCPEAYPQAWYYLGLIAWGAGEYGEAGSAMEKFLLNPGDKLKEDDYKKAEEIKKQAKFLDQIYKNKVSFDPRPVNNICTFEDEFLPMLSPDNEMIFYTRRYMKQGKDVLFPTQVEELTMARRKEDIYTGAAAMDRPFNTGEGFGGITFSLDNEQLYITICKPEKIPNKGTVMNCDIYTSKWNRDHWTAFENLGDKVNTKDGWEAQPSLSADGKTLFFAGARNDSKGMDIYKTEKQADGTWGPASNLGVPINTDKNEKSPFIHSDSQTLYFASDGHPCLGGYDVYYSRMEDNGKWQSPQNLGYPINTENDEVGFFVSTDGKIGYFSTNQLKQKGKGGYDIFSFDLYKEARPQKVIFVKGKLEDAEGGLVAGSSIEIQTMQARKTTKVDVDSVTGKYAAVVAVKEHEDALMTIKRPGYAFNTRILKNDDTHTGKVQEVNATIQTAKSGKSYDLPEIKYKTSSAEITPESKPVLDAFADYMNENPDLKIEIRGHTDNTGNSTANLALSSDRAFTIMDYLMSKGIPKNRLSFKGYGDTKPIASNSTEEGKAKNRRTEFYVVSQ